MPLNQRTDKENMAHLHNEYYPAVKDNGTMRFAGKWIKLEKIILSEVTQTRKDKQYILRCVWTLAVK